MRTVLMPALKVNDCVEAPLAPTASEPRNAPPVGKT
jgi:hypothetical protein